MILAAACPDGTGSAGYERWMLDGGFTTHEQVLERYAAEGYRIGPHKAWQIARDATRVRLMFVSDMPRDAGAAPAAEPLRRRSTRRSGAALADLPAARAGLASCHLPTQQSRCYASAMTTHHFEPTRYYNTHRLAPAGSARSHDGDTVVTTTIDAHGSDRSRQRRGEPPEPADRSFLCRVGRTRRYAGGATSSA